MSAHKIIFTSLLAILALGLAACDTAPLRVPGLSFSFPETMPAYQAPRRIPGDIFIENPVDARKAHLGEDVANTGWTACETDTLPSGDMPILVGARLQEAIEKASLFQSVTKNASEAQWTLIPEVQVLCSQTRGFIGRRAAGLATIEFTLKHNGNTVWKQKIAHVVTDADPEYTGSFVTTVTQAMRRVMADSLRLVFQDALKEIEQSTSSL